MNANAIFCPADILLPDLSRIDGTRWSTIACDQYTSQPDYWERVRRFVGDAPSTLRLMLPEIDLEQSDSQIPVIHRTMETALKSWLIPCPGAMLLLERTQADGRVRRGIIGAVDLEAYDYRAGAVSPIRATEGTVLERIPPRVKIRRGAPIEMPHIMLLFDDPQGTVIPPLVQQREELPLLYDYDLMENGGHVRGYLLNRSLQADLTAALGALCEGQGDHPLLFAVGDGNHSLASAKAAYEEIKAAIGSEAARSHPARYALAEIVNLHDTALDFEPIYRVVFGAEPERLAADFRAFAGEQNGSAGAQDFCVVTAAGEETVTVRHPAYSLPVATLQAFLDSRPGLTVDYIHGKDALHTLAGRPDAVGFLFRGMEKADLFPAVLADGALPRKTFSMGHAHDKRFYLECRKLQ